MSSKRKVVSQKRKIEEPVVAAEPIVIQLTRPNVSASNVAKYYCAEDVKKFKASMADEGAVFLNTGSDEITTHLFSLEGVVLATAKYNVKDVKGKTNGKAYKIEETNFMFRVMGDEEWNGEQLQEQIKPSENQESPHAILVELESQLKAGLGADVSILSDSLVLFAKSGADERMVAVENFDGTTLGFEELFEVSKKGADFKKQHGSMLCNALVKLDDVFYNEKGHKFYVNLRLVKLQLKNVKIEYKDVY